MKCKVPECEAEAVRGRMCAPHRNRHQKYGDYDVQTPHLPHLPSEPLIALVERAGGVSALTDGTAARRAYVRAKTDGSVTVWQADVLAHELLGLHPCEVWPMWYGPVDGTAHSPQQSHTDVPLTFHKQNVVR